MTCADDIRCWVMALPEVEETSHFRFGTPVWKVCGRVFLGRVQLFCRDFWPGGLPDGTGLAVGAWG